MRYASANLRRSGTAVRAARMHEAETAPTLTSETQLDLAEPYVGPRPGSASPSSTRAKRSTLRSLPAPRVVRLSTTPSRRWRPASRSPRRGGRCATGSCSGLERVSSQEPVRTAGRSSGATRWTRSRHAHRADRVDPAHRRRERERQRPPVTAAERRRRRSGAGGRGRRRRLRRGVHRRRGARHRVPRRRPGRIAPLPLPAPDRVRQDHRGRGFVEAARELGVLILTHRRLLVSQFQRDLTTEGYGRSVHRSGHRRREIRKGQPDHDPDVRVVRTPRIRARPLRVPPRALRRGAHGARREDERCDPCLPRAALHRHDRDGAADRQAGLRRLPASVDDLLLADAARRGSSRRSATCACRRRLPSTRC